jgi:hypothetical protein
MKGTSKFVLYFTHCILTKAFRPLMLPSSGWWQYYNNTKVPRYANFEAVTAAGLFRCVSASLVRRCWRFGNVAKHALSHPAWHATPTLKTTRWFSQYFSATGSAVMSTGRYGHVMWPADCSSQWQCRLLLCQLWTFEWLYLLIFR